MTEQPVCTESGWNDVLASLARQFSPTHPT